MKIDKQAVNPAPIVAMLRAAAALPNSGLSQQLDFHELGWLRTPLRRRCCASVGGEERKPPIFTRLPSPVTRRGADEFWSEGIASDANPFLAVFCRRATDDQSYSVDASSDRRSRRPDRYRSHRTSYHHRPLPALQLDRRSQVRPSLA